MRDQGCGTTIMTQLCTDNLGLHQENNRISKILLSYNNY